MNNIVYPPRLSLARLPTPFQPLDRLSEQLGGPRVWVKRDDLTDCAISGNKIRKLEFTLARALEQGCDTLITCGGVQSNHCRATALLGAQLGLKVHLILRDDAPSPGPGEEPGQGAVQDPHPYHEENQQQRQAEDNATPDGNLFLDQLAGAKISRYEKKTFQRELPALFEKWSSHYQALGGKPYLIPTGASDGTGVWGYVNCIPELKNDFETNCIRPQTIIHATGSGGTQAGLSAGAMLHGLASTVTGIAVCDNADYFENKVRSDINQWQDLYCVALDPDIVPIDVDDRFIGPGYGQATKEVFDVIRNTAALEGLVLDPVYTGKAFHGMIEKIKAGEFSQQSDIVFIHTGGIFGLLAQRAFISD